MKKNLLALLVIWFLLYGSLVFAAPPSQTPTIWACDPGTVAYNCARLGLPMPKFAAPTWENGGNKLYDYIGNQIPGDINDATWEKGGLKFSATDYVAFDDSDIWTWTPVDEDRTLSFWFYPTVLPTNYGNPSEFLVTAASSGNHYQFIFYHSGGATYLMCSLADNSWNNLGYFMTPWSPTLNTWYHITFVASSATNCEIYIDGIKQSVTENSWNDNTAINPTVMHIVFSTGEGILKNYLFWHDKISQAQNNVLYNNPYGIFNPISTVWYISPPTGLAIKSINGILWTNIKSVDGLLKANIKSINEIE